MSQNDLDGVNAILNVEADRRLLEVARRSDSAVSRATVIVGAAVVITGLQVIGADGWLRFAVVLAALAAAALSIAVMTFRNGGEIPLASYQAKAAEYTTPILVKYILEQKLEVLATDESVLKRQTHLLLASYLCFGAANVCALVSISLKL